MITIIYIFIVVGLRVDLSSNSTFADLILSLWGSLQSARCHSHFPFSLVAEEVSEVKNIKLLMIDDYYSCNSLV